jgi:putative addiction module component (TIGR02574 family)
MNYSTLEQTVLGLPKTERAHLLQLLLDSLDTPSENEVQEAWLAEANRRAAEIDSGKVILVSGEQLEKEVQALLK